MPSATIKFSDREISLGPGLITIGRTTDNTVSFPNDSNVSRFHAEIETRGGEDFYLKELGSSNGTTVNGSPVTTEVVLNDGDTILLGGSSEITFELPKEETPAASMGAAPSIDSPADGSENSNEDYSPTNESEEERGSRRTMFMIAGGACLIAAIAAGAAGGYYYYSKAAGCTAKVSITKPESGETISEATEIVLEVEDAPCVEQASFQVDGAEFAKSSSPYVTTLNPKDFPALADGEMHGVTAILLDKDGNVVSGAEPIVLGFETRVVEKPADPIIAANTTGDVAPKDAGKKAVSLIEVQGMVKGLVKQFPGNRSYNLSNKQFLQEVQKKTAEFVQDGYFARASQYRDTINVAYVQEHNLPASLGFILAMSRSNFTPGKTGNDIGLWKMSDTFITANAYNGTCGDEKLTDANQACAAKSSALYLKSMYFGVFDSDLLLTAAAFGKSPQDAGEWKAKMPANKFDVWNVIKTAPEREQLVRFFAAGIVAENPEKFGLKNDKPISTLYPPKM